MLNQKNYKCDVRHMLLTLPSVTTVTPSRTPSPLECDVLYGRHLSRRTLKIIILNFRPRVHQTYA